MSRRSLHLAQILWPAFLIAGVLEMVVFALVDPTGLVIGKQTANASAAGRTRNKMKASVNLTAHSPQIRIMQWEANAPLIEMTTIISICDLRVNLQNQLYLAYFMSQIAKHE